MIHREDREMEFLIQDFREPFIAIRVFTEAMAEEDIAFRIRDPPVSDLQPNPFRIDDVLCGWNGRDVIMMKGKERKSGRMNE